MLGMAVLSNGKPAKKGDRGLDRHQILRKARKMKKSTWPKSIFSMIIRLIAWYSIATVAFRCPSNIDLTDDSPRICEPYLQARNAILPHIEPYYDAYAAPYVEIVNPYYHSIDEHVFAPVTAFGRMYGGPKILQAQKMAQEKWTNTVQPHLTKYKDQAKQQYRSTLGPYAVKAGEAVRPYYGICEKAALKSYHEIVLPAYNTVKPHALCTYGYVSDFVVNTGIPYTQWAWISGTVFLERKVWPRVRILYGENVEPQLLRIGERLGRYRDGRQLRAKIEEMDIPSSEAVTIQSTMPIASAASSSSVAPEVLPSSSSQDVVSSSLEHDGVYQRARAMVSGDLKEWQDRFAKAADEGSDELEARVSEITEKLIHSQVNGVAEAMLIEMEETVQSQMRGLRKTINSIVENAPEKPEQELMAALRKSGATIKDKAQAVRTWRQNYNMEMNDLITKSSQETFNIIDHIAELGITEIGRRWAWTDGITHKDWRKYHALREKFDEWRLDVEDVVTKHPGLLAARAAADDIENRAMSISEDASQELLRLKNVGKWKIATGDSSDDFSTKILPAVVENAAQKVVAKIDDLGQAISGTTPGIDELSSVATASSISGEPGHIKEVPSSIKSVASALCKSIPSLDDVSRFESSSASEITCLASSVANEDSVNIPNAKSKLSSSASGKVWGGAEAQFVSATEIIYDDIIEDDSEDHFSQKIISMANEAGDKFSDVTSAVSEALLGSTPSQGSVKSASSLAAGKYSSALAAASKALYGAPQGTGESIASVASSRYSEAVSAASVAIYGTPTPLIQSLASKASATLWPTQRALESISSVAASKLSDALNAASAQYLSVKTAVGATPTPSSERLLSQARQQYYIGIGMAHERYSEFIAAASSAVLPTSTPFHQSLYHAASTGIVGTPTPAYKSVIDAAKSQYDSASSVAKSALDEALSSASKFGTSAAAAVPTSDLIAKANSKYSSVVAEASETLASASAAASVQIYGSETGTLESMTSKVAKQAQNAAVAASTNWENAMSLASVQVYGQPTPVYESIYSQASDYASQATAGVAAQYEAVQAIISELIIGKEPDFTESVYSRFSSAYYTAAPEAYASATSLANENAAAASSYASEAYDAASSVLVSVFTPPPAVEDIIANVSAQLDAAVVAASAQIYGTTTGYADAASASASSVYHAASEAIYGHETGYVEAASSSIANAAESAVAAISIAMYGTSTGSVEAVTDAVGDKVASATSVVGESFSVATDGVGEIYNRMFGEEEKDATVDSARERIGQAVESARSRIADMVAGTVVEKGAGEGLPLGSATARVTVSDSPASRKDEL